MEEQAQLEGAPLSEEERQQLRTLSSTPRPAWVVSFAAKFKRRHGAALPNDELAYYFDLSTGGSLDRAGSLLRRSLISDRKSDRFGHWADKRYARARNRLVRANNSLGLLVFHWLDPIIREPLRIGPAALNLACPILFVRLMWADLPWFVPSISALIVGAYLYLVLFPLEACATANDYGDDASASEDRLPWKMLQFSFFMYVLCVLVGADVAAFLADLLFRLLNMQRLFDQILFAAAAAASCWLNYSVIKYLWAEVVHIDRRAYHAAPVSPSPTGPQAELAEPPHES